MKNVYIALLLLLPTILMAKEPSWAKKLPIPDSNTYEYRCEVATDVSKEVAEQKALAQIMNNTIMRLGLAVNSADVQKAIEYGTSMQRKSASEEYRIPVNKVCSYVEKIEGGYRCYVLCQVAMSGAIKPQWGTFNNCGPAIGKDIVEVDYPSDWKIYETEDYFASFQREQYDKGTKQTEAIASLLEIAERDLRSKLGIEEGNTDFNIYTDNKTKYLSNIRSDGEDAFVVIFISRNQLIKYYSKAAENFMTAVHNSIVEAQELAKTEQKGEAEILLQTAQQQLNEAIRNTHRLENLGEDISEQEEDNKSCQNTILTLQKKVEGIAGKGKRDKINNYVDIAVEAQNDARISEALKYYYWANVLLNTFPESEANLIKYTDEKNKELQLKVWLPKQIMNLLKDITFSYTDVAPEDPEVGMINVTYHKMPVKSLDYRYYTSLGWSELCRAKDGTGVVRFLKNDNEEQKLILKIEYAFKEETAVDREIANLLEKYKQADFSKEATKKIDINKTTERIEENITLPIQIPTDAVRVASEVKEGKYAGASMAVSLTKNDAYPYRVMIDNICEAIRARKINTVTSYFTTQGKKLFTHLTQSGRITILDKKNINFYRVGNNVVARAVKMSFDYESNHKTFVEDVVFEFNQEKKIENLRYMLERGTIEDIAKQEDWSDAAKLALTDFLENYKSSYALRDTTYLQHVFDNNAIIIVGRVIKPLKDQANIHFGDEEHIAYTRHTKQSYLAALSRTFKNNSFVNVAFSDLYIKRVTKFEGKNNMYGLRLKQTFSSTNYGDQGYLFLMMDLTNYERPVIYVRTWQPKPDMEKLPGNGLFSDADFN